MFNNSKNVQYEIFFQQIFHGELRLLKFPLFQYDPIKTYHFRDIIFAQEKRHGSTRPYNNPKDSYIVKFYYRIDNASGNGTHTSDPRIQFHKENQYRIYSVLGLLTPWPRIG